MKLIGLVRLGRDAELRYTPSGDPVCNFSGAFNYGRKDDDGKQPSQWVEFALWGNRADKLVAYLLKGTQLFVVASDAHVETFERRDGGSGAKLVARVDDLQFAGSRSEGDRAGKSAPAEHGAAARPAAAKPKPATGFDDMDDDIPF